MLRNGVIIGDPIGRPFIHRRVTAADSLTGLKLGSKFASLVRGNLKDHEAENKIIPVRQYRGLLLRFWVRDAVDTPTNETFRATVVGWSDRYKTEAGNNPFGNTRFETTTTGLVIGTSSPGASLDPLTGEAITGTFQCVDTIVPSTSDAADNGSGCNYVLLNSPTGGANREAGLWLDVNPDHGVFVFLDQFSKSFDEVLVIAQRTG